MHRVLRKIVDLRRKKTDVSDLDVEMEQTSKSTREEESFEQVAEEAKKRYSFLKQLQALTIKNLIIQKRNKATNCCQISTPIVLLLLLFIAALYVNRVFLDAVDENRNPTLTLPFLYLSKPTSAYGVDQFLPKNASAAELDAFAKTQKLQKLADGHYYYFEPPIPDPLPILYSDSTNSGNNLTSEIVSTISDQNPSVDIIFEKFLQPFSAYWDNPDEEDRYPFGIEFKKVNGSGQINDILYTAFNDPGPQYPTAMEFTQFDLSQNIFSASVWFNYSLFRGGDLTTSLNFVLSALETVLDNDQYSINFAGVRSLPVRKGRQQVDIISLLGSFFFMIILHQLYPVFMSQIVYEKEKRLVESMKMKGLKMRTYWLVNYVYDYFVYFILMSVLIIMGCILMFNVFLLNTFLSYFILFVLWGFTLISFSFFSSIFFSKAQTSTVFGYFYIIAITIAANNLIDPLINVEYPQDGPINALCLIPSFALYRGMFYLFDSVRWSGDGMRLNQFWDPHSRMGAVYLWLLGHAIFWLACTWYLEQVIPRTYGLRKSIFFPITDPIYFIYGKIKPKSLNDRSSDEGDGSVESLEGEDDSVHVARKIARTNDKYWALAVVNVIKTYESTIPGLAWTLKKINSLFPGSPIFRVKKIKKWTTVYNAVNDVSFVIPQGQCLGILGPNGAGKTSLFAILSGLYPSTNGTAKIFGFDVNTDISKIHTLIGVCPQHDLLWENMTGKEHLEFFGRLKNLSGKQLDKEVAKALKSVKLWEARNKAAGNYSGGMKRRLSVAISLMGFPKLLYLDEPSTGLDPKSKRALWDVIEAKKSDTTIVLTTHSMEEAEALCDNLIIMAKGKIKCVGSAPELKSKFGRGYKLSIHGKGNKDAEIDKFVNEKFKEVSLLHSLAGMKEYLINDEELELGNVFKEMEENSKKLELLDWGITNTTLEEVFHEVISDEKEMRDQIKNMKKGEDRDLDGNEENVDIESDEESEEEKNENEEEERKDKEREEDQEEGTQSSF